MEKVKTLFKRDYEGTRLVYDEVVEGAEWVIEGEGIATEKIDGTACMVKESRLYKRYDVKRGKMAPDAFMPAQEPDHITGHWPGWVPVGDGPEDKWHREAWDTYQIAPSDGTYELAGPKVQGNKQGLAFHQLLLHGAFVLLNVPRDFDGLKQYFEKYPQYEGVVWWHPDGRMVKIKRKDFGLKW